MAEYLNNKEFERIIDAFQTSRQIKNKLELFLEDLLDRQVRLSLRGGFDPEQIKTAQTAFNKANFAFKDAENQLALAFYKLAENIVRYAKFSLVDPDEAIQEGALICFEKIERFDPRKGKAFNYMTTCILNHFRQLYRQSKNYILLKKRYKDALMLKISCIDFRKGREVPLS